MQRPNSHVAVTPPSLLLPQVKADRANHKSPEVLQKETVNVFFTVESVRPVSTAGPSPKPDTVKNENGPTLDK